VIRPLSTAFCIRIAIYAIHSVRGRVTALLARCICLSKLGYIGQWQTVFCLCLFMAVRLPCLLWL